MLHEDYKWVKSFIDSQGCWNITELRRVMEEEWVDKVRCVPIPRDRPYDEFYWTLTNDGDIV